MSWIKPILEITPKSHLEFVSLGDPELDTEATDKELLSKYSYGSFELLSDFIWKGNRTLFICRPLKIAEWNDIQMEAIVKISNKNMDDQDKIILASKLVGLAAFRCAFRSTKCDKEVFERAKVIDVIPLNVQEEIGQYIIRASTVISPL